MPLRVERFGHFVRCHGSYFVWGYQRGVFLVRDPSERSKQQTFLLDITRQNDRICIVKQHAIVLQR